MKKILRVFFALLMVLGISACNLGEDGDNEEEREVTFAEYLENSEGITVSKLNDIVGPIEIPDSTSFLTDLDIQKTKISVETEIEEGETIGGDMYMWGETESSQKYVYVNIPSNGMSETMNLKVNLSDLEESVNELLEETAGDFSSFLVDIDDSGEVEFDEVVDTLLEAYGIDTNQINVAAVLSKIDFNIDDFEDKGNGVYKLKASAISETLVDVLGDLFTDQVEDLEEIEDYIEEYLNVEVKYEKEHIQQVEIQVKSEYVGEENYFEQTMKITFKFTYNEDEISETQINVVNQREEEVQTEDGLDGEMSSGFISYAYSSMALVIGENEFSLSSKIGNSALDIRNSESFSIVKDSGKTTISLSVRVEDEDPITLELEVIGNWLSSLSASSAGTTYEVESNVNVVIPNQIKTQEAEDVTELVKDYIIEILGGQEG